MVALWTLEKCVEMVANLSLFMFGSKMATIFREILIFNQMMKHNVICSSPFKSAIHHTYV